MRPGSRSSSRLSARPSSRLSARPPAVAARGSSGGSSGDSLGRALGRSSLIAAAACGLLAAASAPAWAKSEKQLGYSPQQVWSPLVRFLRVDENVKIVDKDAEAGYLIFELTQDKKVFRGSVELIAASKDYGARIILDVADRPSYVELGMLERLERKLYAELGPALSPPAPPSKKKDGKDAKDPGPPGSPGDGEPPRPQPPTVREAPLRPIPETPASPSK